MNWNAAIKEAIRIVNARSRTGSKSYSDNNGIMLLDERQRLAIIEQLKGLIKPEPEEQKGSCLPINKDALKDALIIAAGTARGLAASNEVITKIEIDKQFVDLWNKLLSHPTPSPAAPELTGEGLPGIASALMRSLIRIGNQYPDALLDCDKVRIEVFRHWTKENLPPIDPKQIPQPSAPQTEPDWKEKIANIPPEIKDNVRKMLDDIDAAATQKDEQSAEGRTSAREIQYQHYSRKAHQSGIMPMSFEEFCKHLKSESNETNNK